MRYSLAAPCHNRGSPVPATLIRSSIEEWRIALGTVGITENELVTRIPYQSCSWSAWRAFFIWRDHHMRYTDQTVPPTTNPIRATHIHGSEATDPTPSNASRIFP